MNVVPRPSGVGRSMPRPPPAAAPLPPLRSTKVLRERIRMLYYSHRTEDAYVHWCRSFIRFHGTCHPAEMGGPEVESFLGWLAADQKVSASTHNQALSALLFLYGRCWKSNCRG